MKEKRKLTEKEKKELKDHIKKVSFSILHVISYILSIMFIISIAIGCSKNTKQASAVESGRVTTPVVTLPLRASSNAYSVKATNINASLPQDYNIFFNYPNYDVNESFMPYISQFDVLNSISVEDTSTFYFLIPLYNYRGSNDYTLRLRLTFVTTYNYASVIQLALYGQDSFLEASIYAPQFELNKDIFNELIYYNSYIKYSLSGAKYAGSDTGSIYVDIPSNKQTIYLNYLRSIWYYFSRDSWVDNLHLTSESILGANNFCLKNLKYEGLVGENKQLLNVAMGGAGQYEFKHYLYINGSFYYKGEVYTSLVFYYEEVYKGDNSEYQLYVGDVQNSSVVNQKLLYDCNDSSFSDLYYLSKVSLCKTPSPFNATDLYNPTYEAMLYHVYESNFVWQGFNQHQIFLNLFASQQSLSSNVPYDIASIGSEYDLPFGYIYPNQSYNVWNFYQNITNSWVVPVIIDNDDVSVEDMFAQTYKWMIFAINSFAGILSFTILPGITLGAVLLTPLVVTLIIFVAKLFKR